MRRLAIVGVVLLSSASSCRREAADEHEKSAGGEKSEKGGKEGKEEKKPFTVEPSKDGEPIVVLTAEAFAAAGIAMGTPTAREVADEVETFGVLVADPSRVGVLRAPVAGAIVATSEKDASSSTRRWPTVGARVEAGATLGSFQPRSAPLTTAELADLQSKLAVARAERIGTEAELDAAKKALDRAKQLNSLDKGVSDQVVEAAAAAVKATEAKLDAAKTSVAIFETAASSKGALVLEPTALVAPRSGEVVAVLAQPGENVEAGAELVRVADFGELFADVRGPPTSAAFGSTARVVVDGATYDGRLVGPAPESDALGKLLRVRVADSHANLRPGLAVTVRFDVDRPAKQVVEIPSSAVLRYASRTWVYVETEEREFTRRAITILRAGANDDSVFVSSGLEPSAKLVVGGAMTLLSEEQQNAGGGEGGGE